MPMTVNGVGTHYYGKKNLTVRTAACASCNRVGELESYDTRLWFVIIFIPIIPLGRKRIMDSCPACNRHFVASADAYDQARQLETSASLERYEREPAPDTALVAHGQLLGFREHERAAEFRSSALQKFPSHVGLRVGLARQLRHMQSHEESDQLFQQAFDIDPDDPDARSGVALRKMVDGKLDEARALVKHLEEPGAGLHYSLEPLDILAGYYQRAGRHEDTLQLSEILLREWPQAGNLYTFRTFVRTSEKALGRAESILPARQFSLVGLFRAQGSPYAPWQRSLVIGGSVVALVLAALAINNEYIRRHRTLHVVNATGAEVQIQVDGQAPVAVAELGQIALAEGPHTIHIKGPVEETHTIELTSGYLARWFKSPAWVLNVGGEAVLEQLELIYSSVAKPARRAFLVGESFVALPQCDYLFTKAPDRLSVSSKSADVTKTELDWVRDRDSDAFHAAADTNHRTAMDFAQRRLRRRPEPKGLLKAVLLRATAEDMPGLKKLLASGLDVRPVSVSWHRAYQMLAEQDVAVADLAAEYDRYLAAEPDNGALLYLRGRLESDSAKENPYFNQAVKADPQLAWPRVALASRASSWARWQECLAAVDKARQLPLEDADLLNEVTHLARLATGDAEKLVGDYRARLAANPFDPVTLLYLVDALVVSAKVDEVDAAIATWESNMPEQFRPQVVPHVKAFALYVSGRVQDCVALCGPDPILQRTATHAHALLATGKAAQAASDPNLAKVWDDPWHALALSLALKQGAHADAAKWHAKALEKLKGKNFAKGKALSLHQVVEILNAKEAPSLDEMALPPTRAGEKALMLAYLAAQFPARQNEYLALAAKLNVRRAPPYLVVQQALNRKLSPKQ